MNKPLSIHKLRLFTTVLAGVVLFVGSVRAAGELVNLCFTALGPSSSIWGNLPGELVSQLTAGVLKVTIDGTIQQAFCTDINNPINIGCYQNSQVGVTNQKVACTLQYYPPILTITDAEAAVRQAAVWHFFR
jgi:hypothetical protein